MWSSHLALLLCSIFMVGVLTAQDRPGIMPIEPPREDTRPIRPPVLPGPVSSVTFHSEQTRAEIEGSLARIERQLVFRNHGRGQGEGTFLLPMPTGAIFDSMEIEIDGQKVSADVLDAKDARDAYEAIVRAVRDPALLEYVDATTVRLRIFPVPPGGDFPVTLRYVVPLAERGGFLELELDRMVPLASTGARTSEQPGKSEGDIKVRIKDRGPDTLIASPTHKVTTTRERGDILISVPADEGPRRLVLLVGGEPADAGTLGLELVAVPATRGDSAGTFMLMLRPPVQAAGESIPRTVTFVLDVSGSMNWENRIDQARRAMQQAIRQLRPADSFNIITFSTLASMYADAPLRATADNKTAAIAFVEGLTAGGGTNIEAAYARALEQKAPTDLHQILFLTDGEPTVGERSVPRLVEQVREANTQGLRVFTLGIGTSVNTRLLDETARETNALSGYVTPDEDLELRLGAFLAAVAEPALTDLELVINGIRTTDVLPTPLPDLFANNSFTILGRYEGTFEGSFVVRGKRGDEVIESRIAATPALVSDGASYVERLWANRMIGQLLEAHRAGEDDEELRAEILRLGNRYGIVTPFTSALALDDSEMPQRRRGPGLANMPDTIVLDTVATYDPAVHGTRSAGDVWRTSGDAAVAQSRDISERRLSTTIAAPAPSSLGVQFANGHTFNHMDGVWVQDELPADATRIEIAFLGEVWWLLHEQDEWREVLALGDRVQFQLGDIIVVVTEDDSDNALARIRELL